jgi:TIR domain-containing protein
LKESIHAAPQLFVFWCEHSAVSRQVRREFMYAFKRKKRVVPVLLDDTPLAPRLAPIQGIDLRGAVAHAGRHSAGEKRAAQSPKESLDELEFTIPMLTCLKIPGPPIVNWRRIVQQFATHLAVDVPEELSGH